jgi:hypothetical protein
MVERILQLMSRGIMSTVIMLACVAACTTMPMRNPRVEVKLQEADSVLYTLSADLSAFYEKLSVLFDDIKALYQHPGWDDMEAIIASDFSDFQDEDESSSSTDLKAALGAWSRKWGDSGERFFSRYLTLVDRCSASEARRIGLIGRLASIQATYLEAVLMELSANRYSQAKAIFDTVEALGSSENELNSYALNSIDLYEVK